MEARSGGRVHEPETKISNVAPQGAHCVCLTSITPRTLSSKVWVRRHQSAPMGPLSRISSAGIVPSHVSPSDEPSFCDTGTSWKAADSRQPQSTLGWQQCDVLPRGVRQWPPQSRPGGRHPSSQRGQATRNAAGQLAHIQLINRPACKQGFWETIGRSCRKLTFRETQKQCLGHIAQQRFQYSLLLLQRGSKGVLVAVFSVRRGCSIRVNLPFVG